MRPTPLPAGLDGRPFTVHQSDAFGISRARLRAADLVMPYVGIRTPAGLELDLRMRAVALGARLPDDVSFSHETAALLLGAPLPLGISGVPLHVSRPAPTRAVHALGIVGHRLSPAIWSAVHLGPAIGGVNVTSPLLTWSLLAERFSVPELVAVADAFLAHPALGVTLESLLEVTKAHSRRRGAPTRAAAATLARLAVRSRPESLARLLIVFAGLPEPLLNAELRDRFGRLLAIPDMWWPQWRIVLEYEGDWHRTDITKFRSDIARFEMYRAEGLTALRLTADDVFADPNPFLGRLANALRMAGAPDIPASLARQLPMHR